MISPSSRLTPKPAMHRRVLAVLIDEARVELAKNRPCLVAAHCLIGPPRADVLFTRRKLQADLTNPDYWLLWQLAGGLRLRAGHRVIPFDFCAHTPPPTIRIAVAPPSRQAIQNA